MNEYERMKNSNVERISTELEHFLYNCQMLRSVEQVRATIDEIKVAMNKRMILTIMPTENCNFKCSYCYENHEQIVMSEKQMNGIIKFVGDKIKYINRIDINWFGGEPTLQFDIIRKTNEGIRALLNEENKVVLKSGMTTNGYLLTKKEFVKYYNLGITKYQITLDGFNHDSTRPLCNGQPTLKKIIDNLIDISSLSRDYKFEITIRRNILPNDDLKWYNFINTKFGEDKRFSVLIRAVGNFGGTSVEKLNLIKSNKIKEELMRHNDYLIKIGMSSQEIVYGKLGVPFEKMCYAAYPLGLVFRANGNIEKCTICLSEEKNVVGQIKENGEIYIDETKNLEWSKINLASKCFKCAELLSCCNLECPQKNIFNPLQIVCDRQ